MKTLTVNGKTVQLNNGSENTALTAELARRAVRIAYGHLISATVTDQNDGYKVTQSRTRRLSAVELHEAGID